jgi:hypothetical protein
VGSPTPRVLSLKYTVHLNTGLLFVLATGSLVAFLAHFGSGFTAYVLRPQNTVTGIPVGLVREVRTVRYILFGCWFSLQAELQ